MKNLFRLFIIASVLTAIVLITNSATLKPAASLYELKTGTPDFQTLGSLTFGPDNILFAGDSQTGAIYAFAMDDAAHGEKVTQTRVEGLGQKVAAMLGTTADGIRINDLAVNPKSQKAYISVTRGNGNDRKAAVMRIGHDGKIEEVSLANRPFAKYTLPNPVAVDAKNRRGGSLRGNAITNLAYQNGHVYAAGLSNEEFASTFRKIPFPFNGKEAASSLEVYHAAHGAFETHAPIRTFLPAKIGGEETILAAYTCTPLVSFPAKQLKNGKHIKGHTLAELGAGNRPLDMIHFNYEGEDYLMIANNRRAVMRFSFKDLASQQKKASLKDPVGAWKTAGVAYDTLPVSGVHHLAKQNNAATLGISRDSQTGKLNLSSLPHKIVLGIFN